MRVELLEYPGERDWIEVYRRALVTVGKDTVKAPSDEWKRKILAARLIGQGVHSGVPDVFIPAARGGYRGIYIELKTGDNRPTPNQNEFMSGAIAEGYYCAVCYGWPCAAAVIEDYLQREKTGGQL